MEIFSSQRIAERKKGLNIIHKLNIEDSKVIVIHYSCESFFNTHGRTPRVTSISIKNRRNNETKSFSIHLVAQVLKLSLINLNDEEYDRCESIMLTDFYQYLISKKGYTLLHWNMRNSNYGFEAISNRYKILTNKKSPLLEDEDKVDLSQVLGLIYTFKYELDANGGKLLNLARRNNISTLHSLTGKQESEAFDNKDYLKLHASTLRKVDIIDRIFELEYQNSLKVNCKFNTIYGINSINGIAEFVKNSPLLMVIIFISGNIFWAAIEPKIQYAAGTDKIEETIQPSKDSTLLTIKRN